MARLLRKIKQGVTYHCYSSCQDLNKFFLYEVARQAFIEAVNMCLIKYKFELVIAEIVDDHFHLAIRTLEDGATIDRIMQYIKARTAEKYNKAVNRKGPFWNERYKCKIVEDSKNPKPYFFTLVYYIAYNLVKRGLCLDPRNNYIGFINCYLTEGYEAPVKITLHPFFYELGNTFAECVDKLLAYEKAYLKRRLVIYPK